MLEEEDYPFLALLEDEIQGGPSISGLFALLRNYVYGEEEDRTPHFHIMRRRVAEKEARNRFPDHIDPIEQERTVFYREVYCKDRDTPNREYLNQWRDHLYRKAMAGEGAWICKYMGEAPEDYEGTVVDPQREGAKESPKKRARV